MNTFGISILVFTVVSKCFPILHAARDTPDLELVFGEHALLTRNISKTIISTSGTDDLVIGNSLPLPHLVCGPISELSAKRLELQELSGSTIAIPIIFIKKSVDIVCFLSEQDYYKSSTSSSRQSTSSSQEQLQSTEVKYTESIEENLTTTLAANITEVVQHNSSTHIDTPIYTSSDTPSNNSTSSSESNGSDTQETVDEAQDVSKWVKLAIPPLMKIDASAINYFQHSDEPEDESASSSSFWSSRENYDNVFTVRLEDEPRDVDSSGLLEAAMITVEFTPFALDRQSSDYWTDLILADTQPSMSLAESSVWELLFHERMDLSEGEHSSEMRQKLARRLSSTDCSLDEKNTKLEIAQRSVHVVNLKSLPDVCVAQMIYTAVSASYVLRVLIDSKPVPYNYYANTQTASGNWVDDTYRQAGLRGTNQIIGIADSGLNDLSCFLVDNSQKYETTTTDRTGVLEPDRRKVIQYFGHADGTDDMGGHGTHVAGTVCGSSVDGTFGRMDGVAPDAKISFYDIGKTGAYYLDVPELYSVLFPAALSSGARVHTNSWGSPRRQYSYQTYDVDRITYENPDLLVLFAAGNSGTSGLKSLGSPANAKNCVAVGAGEGRDADSDQLLSNLTVAWFSSMGPTFDGRIKPDIVAPGSFLMSAFAGADSSSSCSAGSKMGTSMATPAAAGVALQIRQFFMDKNFWETVCNKRYTTCQHGAFTPSGYLLKTMLIHSAEPMKYYSTSDFNFKTRIPSFELGEAPDMFQGYGSVTLTNVLPLKNGAGMSPSLDLIVWDRLNVTQFSTKSWGIHFPVNAKDIPPLKITLCWYDPPARLGYSGVLLVHDLDLMVVAPNGTQYWGNRARYPGDEVNPNEQVYIDAPSSGCVPDEECVYSVYVRANALPEGGSQLVAVVITTSGVVSEPQTGQFPSSEQEMSLPLSVIKETQEKVFETYTHAPLESTAKDTANDKKKSDRSNIIINSGGIKERVRKDLKSDGSWALFTSVDTHASLFGPTQLSVVEERIVVGGGVPIEDDYYQDSNVETIYHRERYTIDTFDFAGTLVGVRPYIFVSKHLNMSNANGRVSGILPYFLSVLVTDPRGVTLQVGGSDWYDASTRLFVREWPRTWARYFFGNHLFEAFRDVRDAELTGYGSWTVDVTLGYNGKVPPYYFAGNFTFDFVPMTMPSCLVEVLTVDTFGDSWGGHALEVEVGGGNSAPWDVLPKMASVEDANVTLTSGQTVSFRVVDTGRVGYAGSVGKSSREPYQVFWVVKSTGQTFVGGYDSKLELQCGVTLDTSSALPMPSVTALREVKMKKNSYICQSCSTKDMIAVLSRKSKDGSKNAKNTVVYSVMLLELSIVFSSVTLLDDTLSSRDVTAVERSMAWILHDYNADVTMVSWTHVDLVKEGVIIVDSYAEDGLPLSITFNVAIPFKMPYMHSNMYTPVETVATMLLDDLTSYASSGAVVKALASTGGADLVVQEGSHAYIERMTISSVIPEANSELSSSKVDSLMIAAGYVELTSSDTELSKFLMDSVEVVGVAVFLGVVFLILNRRGKKDEVWADAETAAFVMKDFDSDGDSSISSSSSSHDASWSRSGIPVSI